MAGLSRAGPRWNATNDRQPERGRSVAAFTSVGAITVGLQLRWDAPIARPSTWAGESRTARSPISFSAATG